MRILTAAAMREVDRVAIEELGIPGMVLMENAAIGVVDALVARFPAARVVAIACGPGNNGGDGLAVARHLAVRGYEVRTLVVPGRAPLAGDAARQLEICRRMGLPLLELGPEDELEPALGHLAGADLLVDALFGTGLSRPLEGRFARLVEALAGLRLPVVAVDLPSGLDGSRPELPGPHLEAVLTVTFAAPKIAHVFAPAADAVGELAIADLGFPPSLVDEAPGDLHLLVASELAAFLVPRPRDAHKGSCGHLLIAGGSAGKSGAVVLAARAAVRSGAGLVSAAVPAPLLELVDGGSVESMTLPLSAATDGGFAPAAAGELVAAAAGKDALVLGPGLGAAAAARAVAREVALAVELPLLLDADGLNAFAGNAAALRGRRAATVLTPHPGELARLLGVATAEVVADRLAAVRAAVAASGAVVVLKGRQTLVAAPAAGVYVNPTGNAGLATGGTGDVLSGMIGALLAQGVEELAAAELGVYWHGLAGDLATARQGGAPLAAGDVIAQLARAHRRIAAG